MYLKLFQMAKHKLELSIKLNLLKQIGTWKFQIFNIAYVFRSELHVDMVSDRIQVGRLHSGSTSIAASLHVKIKYMRMYSDLV